MRPVLTLTDAPGPTASAVIEAGFGRFNEEKAGYRLSSRIGAWSGTWQRGYSSGGGGGETPRVLWLRALYDQLSGPRIL